MKITINEGDWLKDQYFGYYCKIHKMVFGHLFAQLNSFSLHSKINMKTINDYVETSYKIKRVDVSQSSIYVKIYRSE